MDMNDFNRGVIDEFRGNAGRVSGTFDGWPMILVNHRGAKSGKQYTSPLVYTRDGDNYIVIASKGGAPDDPQWYRNLLANPDITIEVGDQVIPVTAHAAEGAERDRLDRAQADLMPNFDEYQANTERTSPVVVLTPN